MAFVGVLMSAALHTGILCDELETPPTLVFQYTLLAPELIQSKIGNPVLRRNCVSFLIKSLSIHLPEPGRSGLSNLLRSTLAFCRLRIICAPVSYQYSGDSNTPIAIFDLLFCHLPLFFLLACTRALCCPFAVHGVEIDHNKYDIKCY